MTDHHDAPQCPFEREALAGFCPDCGPLSRVDEDGCCPLCGATASGPALGNLIDHESRLHQRAEASEARVRGLEAEVGRLQTINEQASAEGLAELQVLRAERDQLREALQRDRFLLADTPDQGESERGYDTCIRCGNEMPYCQCHVSKATTHERDTCADCGAALKVSPPSPVTGGAWHHYCPNEACPSKAPDGRCWCQAPLILAAPWKAGNLCCSADLDHRPCPNCKQWVEWFLSGGITYEQYRHRVDNEQHNEPCPGPNKESDDA